MDEHLILRNRLKTVRKEKKLSQTELAELVDVYKRQGDMLGLHSEFLPASKRYINDYVQYVESDFLAGLGFGATQQLGETTGIYMGYSVDTGRNVYLLSLIHI